MNEIKELPFTMDELALAERIYVQLTTKGLTTPQVAGWNARTNARLALQCAQAFYYEVHFRSEEPQPARE